MSRSMGRPGTRRRSRRTPEDPADGRGVGHDAVEPEIIHEIRRFRRLSRVGGSRRSADEHRAA